MPPEPPVPAYASPPRPPVAELAVTAPPGRAKKLVRYSPPTSTGIAGAQRVAAITAFGGTTSHTATGSTDRRTTTDTASATGLTEPVTIPALAAIAAGRRPVDGGAHRGSTTDTTNTTIAGVSRLT